MIERALYEIHNREDSLSSFYPYGNDNNVGKDSFFSLENICDREKVFMGKDIDLSEQLDSDDTNYSFSKRKQSDDILKNKKIISSCFEQEFKLLGEIVDVDSENEQFTVQASDAKECKIFEIIFSYNEVEETEYRKIVKGQRIIFVCGKQYNGGTLYNSSTLYFRDTPVWSRSEIEKRRESIAHLF